MKVINTIGDEYERDAFTRCITENKDAFELFKHFDNIEFNNLIIDAFTGSLAELHCILYNDSISYSQNNFYSFTYDYTEKYSYINIYNILKFCDYYQLKFEYLDKFIHQIQKLILIHNIIIDKSKLSENIYNRICTNECFINGRILCCYINSGICIGDNKTAAFSACKHDVCHKLHHRFDHTYYQDDEINGFILGEFVNKFITTQVKYNDINKFAHGLQKALNNKNN
jgi:hypothetical protein